MNLSAIRREAERHGLIVRGLFAPDAEDQVPALANGRAAGSLVLLGNVGSSLWSAFSAAPEYRDGSANPLDRWSQRIGEEMAAYFDGRALFPFGGPPYRPFLRWAIKAEAVTPSTLGILIHPAYGLWHAYRFALALAADPDPQSEAAEYQSPCLTCAAKPCLSACPVEAFTGSEYQVDRCVDYLAGDVASRCNRQGCGSRLACPVGEAHRYRPVQARFHMQAFVAARLAARGDRQ